MPQGEASVIMETRVPRRKYASKEMCRSKCPGVLELRNTWFQRSGTAICFTQQLPRGASPGVYNAAYIMCMNGRQLKRRLAADWHFPIKDRSVLIETTFELEMLLAMDCISSRRLAKMEAVTPLL